MGLEDRAVLFAQFGGDGVAIAGDLVGGRGDGLVEPLQLVDHGVAGDEPPRDAKSLVVHDQRFADDDARRNGDSLKFLHRRLRVFSICTLVPMLCMGTRCPDAPRRRLRAGANAERSGTAFPCGAWERGLILTAVSSLNTPANSGTRASATASASGPSATISTLLARLDHHGQDLQDLDGRRLPLFIDQLDLRFSLSDDFRDGQCGPGVHSHWIGYDDSPPNAIFRHGGVTIRTGCCRLRSTGSGCPPCFWPA